MVPQPMRGLVWLLRRLSSRDAADAAVGDLLDELADRTKAGDAPRWPRLWVNAQAIKVALSFAASMTPRLCRSGWHMLRDAVRSLRRSPAYSMLVIVLLAVGIAAGTITYSVVDAVVLRPLALEQGDRLVSVSTQDDHFKPRISADAFREIHDQVTGFESVAKVGIAEIRRHRHDRRRDRRDRRVASDVRSVPRAAIRPRDRARVDGRGRGARETPTSPCSATATGLSTSTAIRVCSARPWSTVAPPTG